MRKIVVCNAKGGCSKTTTAAALATGATIQGKKALAIDLDPQGNLTFIMGGNPQAIGSYELITGKVKPRETVQKTEQGDLISASLQLSSANNAGVMALNKALTQLEPFYDIVVIDTSPTFSAMLLNALAAATDVIIPINADVLNVMGLVSLLQTITKAKAAYNKKLNILGVLLTQYAPRTVLARDIAKNIRSRCKDIDVPVFNTAIRASTAVKEAQFLQKSIYEYAPKSNPTIDYLNLLKEIKI